MIIHVVLGSIKFGFPEKLYVKKQFHTMCGFGRFLKFQPIRKCNWP